MYLLYFWTFNIFPALFAPDPGATESGYYHMFRPTNLRFFNNMAVVVRTEDEKIEALKSIADSVGVAMELGGIKPEMWFGKLDGKKKSRIPDIHSNFNVFGAGGWEWKETIEKRKKIWSGPNLRFFCCKARLLKFKN